MTAPIIVVGIDAADWRLIERWNLENLLLDQHTEIKSICHTHDFPATLEVWPSIATGLPPSEHGVILNAANRPSRSLLYRTAANIINNLPNDVQNHIMSLKESTVGTAFPQTKSPTVFKDGAVKDWPGVTPCVDWQQESAWFSELEAGELDVEDFKCYSLGHVGSHLGWLAGMEEAGVPIAGTHIHYLDYIGHMFAKRELHLREAYSQVNSFVGWLRQRTDRLVILSDHGMQTTITDDPNPGVHSQEAYISTTLDGELPTNVLDIRDWLEDKISMESITTERSETRIDAPRDHLEDLGYL